MLQHHQAELPSASCEDLPEHTPLLQRPNHHHQVPSSYSIRRKEHEQQRISWQSKICGRQFSWFVLMAMSSISAAAVLAFVFTRNIRLPSTLGKQVQLGHEHFNGLAAYESASAGQQHYIDALYDRWESWKDQDLDKLLSSKIDEEMVEIGGIRIPLINKKGATTTTEYQDGDMATATSGLVNSGDVWSNIITEGSSSGVGADGEKLARSHHGKHFKEDDDSDDFSVSEKFRAFGRKVKSWWKPTAFNTKWKLKAIKSKMHALEEELADWWYEDMRDTKHTIQSKIQDLQQDLAEWWIDVSNDEIAKLSDKERDIKSKVQVLEKNFDAWWNEASAKERQWWDSEVASFENFVSSSSSVHVDELHARWWQLTRQNTLEMDIIGSSEITPVGAGGENGEEDDEAEWWEASREWFSRHAVTTTATKNQPKLGAMEKSKHALLYFNTTRAFRLLGWFEHSRSFFYYQKGWDAQINQAYCSVASAAAVMNSFKGTLQSYLPIDGLYSPYPYATQMSLVRNDCVYQNVIHVNETFDGILSFPGGLCLEQTRRLLQCHMPSSSWNVSVVNVNPNLSLEHVTRDLIHQLHDPRSRVMVNIHRGVMGQEGGGHFSVLASYNALERMFLLLDVAKYKYPPVWVPAERLYAAMQTVDRCGFHEFPTTRTEEATLASVTQAYHAHASPQEMEKLLDVASQTIGCRPQYRGYIVVRKI